MMRQSILVSVIMTNYNYGKFISQAIDSVLKQSYSNLELIVVDDGSFDDSKEILDKYSDQRLTVVYQNNQGQAAAFNSGFKFVSGEVVAFLDSDDWWGENKLQTLVEWHHFLQGNYSILQHALNIWHDGEVRPYKNILSVGDCFTEMCQSGKMDFFVPTSGLSFPRVILDRVFPIPPVLKISADAYLMRTTFFYGPVYSIPIALGYYRQHNNSVFKNRDFSAKKFFDEILYPELNIFYSKNDIDFQIKSDKPVSFITKMYRKIKYD